MQVQSFIHHPSEVPIKIAVSDNQFPLPCIDEPCSTGVYIHTSTRYAMNSCVEVEINVQAPAFFAKGYVCSSEPLIDGIGFQTGIVFDCPDTAFAVRMIEQVCHIEQYRQQVCKKEGRELSIDSAAIEWITQHASKFPELNTISG
jgi:hypothetical protein